MKNVRRTILALTIIMFFASCTPVSKGMTIDKYYTTIDKLLQLNGGMKIKEVNKILGVSPFDIMYYEKETYFVLVYWYKHKGKMIDREDAFLTHTEISLTRGQDAYAGSSQIYMFFDNKRELISYYTDKGNSKGINQTTIKEYLKQLPQKEEVTMPKIVEVKKIEVKK